MARNVVSAPVLSVPFNKPYVTGAEFGYIQEAIDNAHLAGNGPFSGRCGEYLRDRLGTASVLLTHSCTGALEMTALLAEVAPGDEVIMPSYTFTTTATSFALRGAIPMFVDVREDTLNLDERLVEAAITERTRAIVAVHYAGVGCNMGPLRELAERHGLMLIEDAAQGFGSEINGDPLGSIGALGALSFHETKNVISGEGGALIVNDPRLVERAEILQEKGTNRKAFFRGQVDKYTWVDHGSSFVASELAAAFLWAQLEHGDWITAQRLAIWDRYHAGLVDLESDGALRRPIIPPGATHNAHMYYLLLPTASGRDAALEELAGLGVTAVFHYVPLHSSPAGRKLGRTAGDLSVTDDVSARLLRLPLWVGMSDEQVEHVIDSVHRVVGK
ncbi:MAG TPA: dTDP-4-amino-4,6-dideoxygalactose transaminase [Solirubrobacteraceae bacterium]|nr:dTDP-4-amino-4,6-dideoxygalactose transaminase [Solirubrobacteraceae bacterium]